MEILKPIDFILFCCTFLRYDCQVGQKTCFSDPGSVPQQLRKIPNKQQLAELLESPERGLTLMRSLTEYRWSLYRFLETWQSGKWFIKNQSAPSQVTDPERRCWVFSFRFANAAAVRLIPQSFFTVIKKRHLTSFPGSSPQCSRTSSNISGLLEQSPAPAQPAAVRPPRQPSWSPLNQTAG